MTQFILTAAWSQEGVCRVGRELTRADWELWLAGVFKIEGKEGEKQVPRELSENQGGPVGHQVLIVSSPVLLLGKPHLDYVSHNSEVQFQHYPQTKRPELKCQVICQTAPR